jgi:hypothetical protein
MHEEEILPHILKLLTDAYERDVREKLHVEPELKLHDAELKTKRLCSRICG